MKLEQLLDDESIKKLAKLEDEYDETAKRLSESRSRLKQFKLAKEVQRFFRRKKNKDR